MISETILFCRQPSATSPGITTEIDQAQAFCGPSCSKASSLAVTLVAQRQLDFVDLPSSQWDLGGVKP